MSYSFDSAAVRSAKIHRLNGYWLAKRGGRSMPSRRDLDPVDLGPILPYLLLSDLTAPPFRVRYRLVGTKVVEYNRFDFTGMYLDDIQFNSDDQFDAVYRLVHGRKAPVFGAAQIVSETGLKWRYEFANFPLSDDGDTVNKCIAIEDYDGLERVPVDSFDRSRRRGPE